MNTLAELQPRFTCRMVRHWISLVGDPTRADQNGHVAHCPDCQAFFSASDELDALLRRDALPARGLPRESLEIDILRAVHRSTRPARGRRVLPLLSFAGVAAAVAFAFIATQHGPRAGAGNPTTSSGPVVAAGELAELLSDVRPQAEELLRRDPLQNEVDAMVAGARGAVDFLAKNFLPTDAQNSLARSRG